MEILIMEQLVSPKGMILIRKLHRAHQNSLPVSIPTPGSEAYAAETDRKMKNFPDQHDKCESDEKALYARVPVVQSCDYDSNCEVSGRLLQFECVFHLSQSKAHFL
jgi:hypothetical protein